MTIDLLDEPDTRPEEENNSGKIGKGYSDPSATYPLPDSLFQSSLSKANRGKETNTLSIGGSLPGLSVELPPQGTSSYPYNRSMKTASGHLVEYDDTPGGERILIKHKTGSGVELRSDGSVITKTEKNSITSIAGSSCIIISGDSDIQVTGNLNLKVAGDMNISCGGDLNIETRGERVDSVGGNIQEKYYGDKVTNVTGSNSEVVCGGNLGTYLGGNTDIIKGNNKTLVQGDSVMSVTGTIKMTSNVLTLAGNSGVIGSEGISYLGKNFFGDFVGNLQGIASHAVQANVSAVTAGNNQFVTGVPVNTDEPDSVPIVSVSIDSGDYIKSSLAQPMNVSDIRTQLRDGIDMSSDVVKTGINTGTLSPSFAQQVPASIERISSRKPQSRIARNTNSKDIKRIRARKNITARRYVPDPFYDVNNLTDIQNFRQAYISKNIKFSRFFYSKLNFSTLSATEVAQLMRQYQLYVDPIGAVESNRGEFMNHRLMVAEGLFLSDASSSPREGSPLWLSSKGRSVTFELYDDSGKIDLDKTFELATYWNDLVNFDRLVLSYDSFDPKGLTCQIIMVMPELDADYNLVVGSYKNELETIYNTKTQAQELVKFEV